MLLVLFGCGTGNSKKLGTVSGIIHVNGTPTPGLMVYFEPADGMTSAGRTDDSGHYELTVPNGAKGAEVGSHKVRITGRLPGTGDPILSEMAAERGVSMEQLKKVPIVPAKYNEQTELSAQVKSGKNDIDFNLEL